jgi:hypothetical protein
MNLSNILAITGKSGLFKLISKTKNNFIVESLLDGKRFPAFSDDGVATLDNILIFTEDKDVKLEVVMQSIFKKEAGKKVEDFFNDNTKMKNYFSEILPDYDRERVYVSNIKKVLLWYNLLVENNLIDDVVEEAANEVVNDTPEESVPEADESNA